MVLGNILGTDGVIVLIIVLVVIFGGSQLPKIARNIGSAGKEFRKAQAEAEQEELEKERAKTPAAPTSPAPPAAPPAPTPLGAAPVAPPAPEEGKVTLTQSQLDALLKEREEQTRRQPG